MSLLYLSRPDAPRPVQSLINRHAVVVDLIGTPLARIAARAASFVG